MGTHSVHVQTPQLPDQATYHGTSFPLVMESQSGAADLEDTLNWIRDQKQELDRKAMQHGAILFRGFGLSTVEDLDQFIRAFDYANFPYEESLSNAVRVVYTDRVFSANEAPPSVNIYLHHEMAQTPIYPSKLFFYCVEAPDEGGETPLCRSDVLFERMQQECPKFARDCEEKGLLYTNVMPAENDPESGMGRSWQSTLRADTREAAEERLAKLNYSWEWLSDGCLKATTPVLPAVRQVADGRKVFFNQLIAAFCGWKDSRNDPAKAITFGDGARLDPADVQRVAELAESIVYDHRWQPGDVVLVDNILTMHGRRGFKGNRKVLASLVEKNLQSAQ